MRLIDFTTKQRRLRTERVLTGGDPFEPSPLAHYGLRNGCWLCRGTLGLSDAPVSSDMKLTALPAPQAWLTGELTTLLEYTDSLLTQAQTVFTTPRYLNELGVRVAWIWMPSAFLTLLFLIFFLPGALPSRTPRVHVQCLCGPAAELP